MSSFASRTLPLLVVLAGLFAFWRFAAAALAAPDRQPLWRGDEAVIRYPGLTRAFAVVGLVFFAVIAGILARHDAPPLARWPISFASVALVALGIFTVLQALTEFRVDAAGVSRRAISGRVTIAWADVESIELTSGPWVRSPPFLEFVIRSTRGQHLKLPLMIGGVAAFGLYAVERLAPGVRDKLDPEVRDVLRALGDEAAESRG